MSLYPHPPGHGESPVGEAASSLEPRANYGDQTSAVEQIAATPVY